MRFSKIRYSLYTKSQTWRYPRKVPWTSPITHSQALPASSTAVEGLPGHMASHNFAVIGVGTWVLCSHRCGHVSKFWPVRNKQVSRGSLWSSLDPWPLLLLPAGWTMMMTGTLPWTIWTRVTWKLQAAWVPDVYEAPIPALCHLALVFVRVKRKSVSFKPLLLKVFFFLFLAGEP